MGKTFPTWSGIKKYKFPYLSLHYPTLLIEVGKSFFINCTYVGMSLINFSWPLVWLHAICHLGTRTQSNVYILFIYSNTNVVTKFHCSKYSSHLFFKCMEMKDSISGQWCRIWGYKKHANVQIYFWD